MFCPNCGSQQSNQSNFCSNCSAKLPNAPQNTQQVYNTMNRVSPTVSPITPTSDMPMKWFKFLIYFSLIFGAIANIVAAVQYFNGSVYGSTADAKQVYKLFGDSLETLDLVYAASLIVISILMIITRFQLAGYKKSGPTLLYCVYILSIVLSIIYILFVNDIIDSVSLVPPAVKSRITDDLETSLTGSIAVSSIVLMLNVRYFSKRKHLFCN